MKRILSGLSCWLAVSFSLCGAENLPSLMQTGKYDQVKHLVETGGADLEATDRYNRTVLHWAAIANAELIPLLLEKGAAIEAEDGSGMTRCITPSVPGIQRQWKNCLLEKPTSGQRTERRIPFSTLPAGEKIPNRKSSRCC